MLYRMKCASGVKAMIGVCRSQMLEVLLPGEPQSGAQDRGLLQVLWWKFQGRVWRLAVDQQLCAGLVFF